ncbi:MAG: HPr family phosphocarrier protein [Nitrosomonas sp.]|jgi:phosphocarrier protein HPr|uniref:HPr family phosphocarrier protein n=1 Tax=Nitrosomonas sp. TaxID=42353 RepID=UPI00272FCC35|nr:HPr family phosphocarrier protein [Nitrosomonas sp.]MDP1551295.1 HPr family phosphocarrier protein [Nitrosomonas sp.]MDP1786974.1 HPr family phosphocarrier protein [Nitrosomonas sp.]MDP1934233.1 HPr family phosphocarrier protein [Nitrosomonas sp.]MDP3281768.1 HPr family phosphocarrier protein [Nitrosomonas sp.]MDP3664221.1 HPr family phosphocarrier protein [Nitrosomonas sp.]
MQTREVEIVNKLGLHARASAKLTKLASQFKCEVWATKNNRRVNAKSIMGVMTLAANKGSRIQIETTGDDEVEAVTALVALVEDYFGEGE